jgi:hypothetical protein
MPGYIETQFEHACIEASTVQPVACRSGIAMQSALDIDSQQGVFERSRDRRQTIASKFFYPAYSLDGTALRTPRSADAKAGFRFVHNLMGEAYECSDSFREIYDFAYRSTESASEIRWTLCASADFFARFPNAGAFQTALGTRCVAAETCACTIGIQVPARSTGPTVNQATANESPSLNWRLNVLELLVIALTRWQTPESISQRARCIENEIAALTQRHAPFAFSIERAQPSGWGALNSTISVRARRALEHSPAVNASALVRRLKVATYQAYEGLVTNKKTVKHDILDMDCRLLPELIEIENHRTPGLNLQFLKHIGALAQHMQCYPGSCHRRFIIRLSEKNAHYVFVDVQKKSGRPFSFIFLDPRIQSSHSKKLQRAIPRAYLQLEQELEKMNIGTPPCRASLIDMDIGRGRIRESSVYVLSYA